MTIHKELKAIVVGCGSIGALKPSLYDSKLGQTAILTHAHAYSINPDIELVGVVDTDEAKAKEASKKWNCLRDNDLDSAMKNWEPDIVSVCVPTEYHPSVLMQLLKHKPKLVVAEKPFCLTYMEAQKVADAYTRAGVPLLINYTRRFSFDYHELREKLVTGKLGMIYHVRLLYGRGLLRDGCHGLDLFLWMLGNPLMSEILKFQEDYNPDDPTVDLQMLFERCENVQMVGVDSRKYGIFELEIVCEKGIYVLLENGTWVSYRSPRPEPVYGGYNSLCGHATDLRKTDLVNSLSRMVAHAAAHVLRGEKLWCTAQDALGVHRIIDQVREGRRQLVAHISKDKLN